MYKCSGWAAIKNRILATKVMSLGSPCTLSATSHDCEELTPMYYLLLFIVFKSHSVLGIFLLLFSMAFSNGKQRMKGARSSVAFCICQLLYSTSICCMYQLLFQTSQSGWRKIAKARAATCRTCLHACVIRMQQMEYNN